MSVGDAPRVRPLRRGDPEQLGPYRIVGRLGEGGMGTVYLAENADGQRVALKVIRPEIADDDDFRLRFQKEVDRARQVPPFCTAEVLDADTDHDPPYLVVEYVDGPTLTHVVQERGPLSTANQHGLAVGMAVALTAIHGAGVIHRDLKPSNVLLAPGSPKVIDFGIARAVVGHDPQTRTDQMMGTVGYMAPERLEPGNKPLTPAADIFAWGAVVAFAATGRNPFGNDVPAAVAMKIVSGEPDLDGLTGHLRELVTQALAKDPAERPTARQLVDRLLAGEGAESSASDRPAAFAEQPEVLAAAGIVPATEPLTPQANAETVTLPSKGRAAVTPTVVASPRPPAPRGAGQRPAGPSRPAQGPQAAPRRPAPPPAPTKGRRGTQTLITLLAVCVLLLGGAVVGILTGKLPLPNQASANPDPTAGPVTQVTSPAALTSATPTETSSPTAVPTSAIATTTAPTSADASASVAPGAKVVVRDPLTSTGRWIERTNEEIGASCRFDGGLVVTLGARSTGVFKCQGATNMLADFTVAVDVTVPDANSCAGIWFRFIDNAGYVLKVCKTGYELLTHDGNGLTRLSTFPFAAPVADGAKFRVTMRAAGDTFTFFKGKAKRPIGQFTDTTYTQGRVVLGVMVPSSTSVEPFTTTFANITIWA